MTINILSASCTDCFRSPLNAASVNQSKGHGQHRRIPEEWYLLDLSPSLSLRYMEEESLHVVTIFLKIVVVYGDFTHAKVAGVDVCDHFYKIYKEI